MDDRSGTPDNHPRLARRRVRRARGHDQAVPDKPAASVADPAATSRTTRGTEPGATSRHAPPHAARTRPEAEGPVTPPIVPPGPSRSPGRPERPERTERPERSERGERGLRGLVGSGPSQVGISGALRARDAARPTAADLAAADADLVIVRRHYVPPDHLPGRSPTSPGDTA